MADAPTLTFTRRHPGAIFHELRAADRDRRLGFERGPRVIYHITEAEMSHRDTVPCVSHVPLPALTPAWALEITPGFNSYTSHRLEPR